ncbi:ribonucleases P/MRP protein subunit POP1-domain-containing protein [Multifurca ochricompacta]|uniref:Ribonucleases P/MRP protein subunit POP1-domain-containing protein n=1 Tax=Multifurca ochricompacta TaxID=376703 RepID=A0AAD4M9G3_9AGAM|nr:ribonucleases P/MRP protein subunit POP1-domain-containing protein [Multifurca ochricompacta]
MRRASSTHRAWQELPRHLRRRAASHHVRRVPLRLRQKSRAEVRRDPTYGFFTRKILGRSLPKRGKNRRELRSDAFARRQKDKRWLETHLWHAKRMHMENMWGYRLAIKPTEKSFRPSHRASVHGSILHDASYYGLIELRGAQLVLSRALEICCDPAGAGPASKRFLSGIRGWETAIYESESYPFGYIGPIFILWRAMTTVSHTSQPAGVSPTAFKPKGNPRRKQLQLPDETTRVIWVRCHPAIFSLVLSTLKEAVSLALGALKESPEYSQNSYAVEVVDLRDSINVFEIMGPKSSQVIHGALTPTIDNHNGEFKKFWSSLSNLQSTGSIPSNMVVGFTVLDPRLNFPPKNGKVRIAEDKLPTIHKPWECFPTASLAQSDIWDQSIRDALKVPRFTKKEIDARKAQNPIPGTPLRPTTPDNRIPVLLIQRSGKSISSTSSPALLSAPPSQYTMNSDSNLHGWTLIIPKGWGMPFLTSLIYTGTRVGGQRERAHQAFEAGAAYFPRDFPASAAYEEFSTSRAIRDEEEWKKKPPAKRVSWDKLSTLNPWVPAWIAALGLNPVAGMDEDDTDMVPTQRDDPLPASDPAASWQSNIARLLVPASGLLSGINALRRNRELLPLDVGIDASALFQGALLHVRVTLCGRGVPDDMAFIYALEDREARAWAKAHSKQGLVGYEVGQEPLDVTELSKIVPSDRAVIGFVTSGNYSMSRGRGHAIGAVSLARLRQGTDRLVKIRNRDGTVCRAALIDFLE